MKRKDKFAKGAFLVIFGLVFSLSFHLVHAGLIINEIMYDLKTGGDDGREWVEVYNDSDVPVDLTSFRLFEPDTNHKIKLAQGEANLAGKGYAIIVSDFVKFKNEWNNNTLNIFDSSFSLSNAGEVLAIKDKDLNVIDQYAYNSSLGGAGDGKSLQKIGGVWQGATPTPGQENKVSFVPPPPKSKNNIVSKINSESKITTPPPRPLGTPPATGGEARVPGLDKEGARGGNSVVAMATENTAFGFPILLTILLVFVGVSASVVYFIRRKRITPRVGDDFEIIDE